MSKKFVKLEKGRIVDASDAAFAAEFEENIHRQQAREDRRREVWGDDNVEQIVRLAGSFPSLVDADGLDPWDPVAFLAWAQGPASTSGSWHAAMFVLSVWNSTTDWSVVSREQGDDPELPDLRGYERRAAARELGLADTDEAADALVPELVRRAARAVERSRHLSFQVTLAFAVWDDAHREAFLRWCNLPFFP